MVDKTNIWVYAQWKDMAEPKCIGILSVQQSKGRRAFSFAYDQNWINSTEQLLLDPDIAWFGGPQYPNGKGNFGVFLDSMPDTWGRNLMKRRVVQQTNTFKKTIPVLHEIDFLLGVHDFCRMGALRFKLDPNGPFVDNNTRSPIPPWATIRELQYAAEVIESNEDSEEAKKWLNILLAPGSSLGGARPKANIIDENNHLWIAKFPSKRDTIDKGAWEYLVYLLAKNAVIDMSECSIEKVAGKYRTFFTKRFDREKQQRIHFASAMTMTGKNEELIRDDMPSYLEIAEFIQFNSCMVEKDLEQLWRRIVFNIMVSNTDDHLRNHGFILSSKGWRLSPAFDLNPSTNKNGLSLNIDLYNNALDLTIAKSAGIYFRLNEKEMDRIIDEVSSSVMNWRKIASEIDIARNEQNLMAAAFKV